MRRLLLCLALAAAALPAAAHAQAADSVPRLPSLDLPAELERVLRDYERAWRAGDEAALAALFTPDGFVPTRQGWRRGREDVQAVYRASEGPLRLRALAYAVDGEVGYIVGAYGYGSDPAGPDTGKFLLALRRTPGGPWLIAADLDNANRP